MANFSKYLEFSDVVSGQEAVALVRSGGVQEQLFYAKNLTATAEVNKVDIKPLGTNRTLHKPNGWTGSGTMTIYTVTSYFRRMMMTYITTGVPVTFEIDVVNDDPGAASSVTKSGGQYMTLTGCTLDSVVMANFDTDADFLEEEVSFTFDGAIMARPFNDVAGKGNLE
jgi:hypothetical protein